ncbi:YihY/virulence factor BrkB family protein [Granulicella sp. dw_53]|uniref:YihY/virulence factor BrkB family protein n=1 Tax=Granulicella sp. dw_53 TaxID=2719792 RepID=UPI001BD5D24E|nr:YihY/virulence factor BrkB family protein [Granulicella sp. dw_53]
MRRKILRAPSHLQQVFLRAVRHDLFNLAQSTAYSAMVSLFPALIVMAAVIGLLPDTTPLRFQLAGFFDRVLPSDVSPLLQSYFVQAPASSRSGRVLVLAFFVSITGASSVIAKLMEGLRRAYHLPPDCWTVWRRRARAYLLVPLSLLPFVITSSLVVFGHLITNWLAMHVMPSARGPVYVVALLIRWTVALTGSIGLVALLYHLGTPLQQTWKRTLPGAIAATAMWFLSTLTFGWYVTRFANYSQVYGSLGAGIALLFWLYITAFSILCGAEFNAQLYSDPDDSTSVPSTANSPAHIAPRG